MEFLKCRDVCWKGQEKRNKSNVEATTAKHPDSRRMISRYGQGTCAVSHFWENLLPAAVSEPAVSEPAVAICLNSLFTQWLNAEWLTKFLVTEWFWTRCPFRSLENVLCFGILEQCAVMVQTNCSMHAGFTIPLPRSQHLKNQSSISLTHSVSNGLNAQ